jgi:hypothetical protein
VSDLTVLVPTRGRPHNAARLQQAFAATCRADTRLIFGVDVDDPDLPVYREVGVVQVVDPAGPGMVGALNQMAATHADQALNLGFLGDDHCPRTEGWDAVLCEEMKENLGGIAYGNDLVHGPNLPTAVILDARIPLTLGYMAPPTLRHLYVDNVWRDWGVRLKKIAYRYDVVIEHIHPLVGKADNDARYDAVNSGEMFDHDRDAYQAYVRDQLDVDIARLVEGYARCETTR